MMEYLQVSKEMLIKKIQCTPLDDKGRALLDIILVKSDPNILVDNVQMVLLINLNKEIIIEDNTIVQYCKVVSPRNHDNSEIKQDGQLTNVESKSPQNIPRFEQLTTINEDKEEDIFITDDESEEILDDNPS